MNPSSLSSDSPFPPEFKELLSFLPNPDTSECDDLDRDLMDLASIAGLTNYDPTLPDEVSVLLAGTSGDSGAYCVWNYPLNGSQGRVCHLGEAIIDRYLRGELIIMEGSESAMEEFRQFQESRATKEAPEKAEVL